jgi:NAD(P)H-hydrate epimerase
LGRSEETQKTVLEYLSQVSVPVVIDADAIYAIAKKTEIISEKKFLITPHFYEFFILTGMDVKSKNEKERTEAVKEAAQKLKTTILLKGPTDIISNGKEVALNYTGSGYMTKGGCGDTLAGICGALLARGIDPFLTAQAGAYINGKAGELATEKEKEGLLATDLIEAIPKVLH